LFKGDGSFSKNGSWAKYVSTSKKLAEDVQECLLKVGFSGSISTCDPTKKKYGRIDGRLIKGKRLQYTVSVNKKQNEPSLCRARLEEIDYDGYVYCASVRNHTMLVERNGKILFSGNTERKNVLSTIKSYWRTFRRGENVALVMKAYRNDYSESEREAIRTTMRRLKAVCTMEGYTYPPVYLVLDMLSDEEIKGLHAKGDCYISLDRGEGFGLSTATAGAAGNPVIATGFGGATEYLKQDNSYLVDYVETCCHGMPWSRWYSLDQYWAFPSEKHASELMRYVYENKDEAKDRGLKLQSDIDRNLNWKVIGQKIIDSIRSL
jgi:glycosyltransferase involved in cell wall biosynthesis